MAETATKTTNPRSRARSTTAKTTATKATTAAKTTPPVEEEASGEVQKITVTLAPLADTKNYSTFDISKDVDGNATGCVGKFYAPLGTETVKVLIVGPVDVAE